MLAILSAFSISVSNAYAETTPTNVNTCDSLLTQMIVPDDANVARINQATIAVEQMITDKCDVTPYLNHWANEIVGSLSKNRRSTSNAELKAEIAAFMGLGFDGKHNIATVCQTINWQIGLYSNTGGAVIIGNYTEEQRKAKEREMLLEIKAYGNRKEKIYQWVGCS